LHILIFAALAAIGVQQIKADAFLLIRDHLLLSNPVGLRLNNAYYTYTLYAAQVFKSLYQDQIRTCRIKDEKTDPQAREIKSRLVRFDYLTIEKPGETDLEIQIDDENLIFFHRGKSVFRTTQTSFFASTGDILKTVSRQCDRHDFFRRITFLSLVIISGISSYLIIFLPFRILFGMFLPFHKASFLGGICCFIAGAAGLLFWHPENIKTFETKELENALVSEDQNRRLEALRYINSGETDISPSTFDLTLALTKDPQINIAYMAVNALSKRKDRRGIEELLKLIAESDRWYVQHYAYRALRRMGWSQTVSG
jgi:hypothetical protein